MKNILLGIGVLLLIVVFSCKEKDPPEFVETEPHTHTAVIDNINSNCAGYYVGLPASYDKNDKSHPLIISIHGWGALGGANGIDMVVTYSIGSLLENKTFPKNVVSGGKNYSFIVVTPRFKEWPTSGDINAVLEYVLARYRVDASRIYVAGASMGGGVAFHFGGDFPNKAAAIVPFAAAREIDETQAGRIAGANLPVWAFHNKKDQVVSVDSTLANIDAINAYNPTPLARKTIWEESKFGGDHHDSWTRACDPAFSENNMNIYEWMLQYHR